MSRKILFVDRDGTLVQEPPDEQVDRLDKVALVPGVIPALLRLQEQGYVLVMVTNQDGLGTDSFPEAHFRPVHDFIVRLFASQGVGFADVLICPHKPADGCTCRKPHLGLVRPYLEGDLDRARSAVVGDRQTDLDLAANMGLQGFRLGDTTWPDVARALLDAPRRGQVARTTKETTIDVAVDLDGAGNAAVRTGIGFFDHMLEQLARHSGIDLRVHVVGDLHVDEHHTVEDCALALGAALRQALGDKVGIERYGFVLPMDEARAAASIDLSARPHLEFDGAFTREAVGGLPTELVPHFFRSLADALGATLHVSVTGENAHHMVEASFKAVARALGQAVRRTGKGLPSTKGTL